MDLIIYPEKKMPGRNAKKLLSEEGRAKFHALVDWLNPERSEALDCFLILPRDPDLQKEALVFAAETGFAGTGSVFIVVESADVSAQTLDHINRAGLQNLIIRMPGDAGKAGRSLLHELLAWFLKNEGSAISLAFWEGGRSDGLRYRQIREWVAFGVSSEIIEPPLFGMEVAQPAALPEFILAEMQAGSGACALYQETLTIDGAGNLLYCPAHHASEPHQGNLFVDRPDQLIMRKGKCAGLPGKIAMCTFCDFRGRLSWPERKSRRSVNLFRKGRFWTGNAPWNPFEPDEISQEDASLLPAARQKTLLQEFDLRLRNWVKQVENAEISEGQPMVSIEIPVFKGAFLIPCIESVLFQTSHNWVLYTVFDGGDDLSRQILEILEAHAHPRIKVWYSENRGISRSRYFLSSVSRESYILPLDDDDLLASDAVERFLAIAAERPWASVIRARRRYIDESGNLVDMDEWFPFEGRHYQHGMVKDIHNHSQPYLISRAAYLATEGWEGFQDFFYAGEDCDMYLKLEEKGSIELVDDLLYYYRLNSHRTSHELKPEGAYEMWRRLADKAIARIGLSLRRVNDKPPFEYERIPIRPAQPSDIAFVVPFFESDERELEYAYRRPNTSLATELYELDGRNEFVQEFDREFVPFDRLEFIFSAKKPVHGTVRFEIFDIATGQLVTTGEKYLDNFNIRTQTVSLLPAPLSGKVPARVGLRVKFQPAQRNYHALSMVVQIDGRPKAIVRVFQKMPGYSRGLLNRCLNSVRNAGADERAIHLIQKKQSSARNRNEGFEASKLPYVCYIDDDVEIVEPDTFERLLRIMEETGADLIGPKLITEVGTLFCADGRFAEDMTPIPNGLGEVDMGQYNYVKEVTWLPSTLLLVRREVVMAIGGFDEGYVGSQMEDVDFCLKARLRQFKCVYAGTVPVVHYNHQRNDNFALNFQRFYARWKAFPKLFEEIEILKPEEA